MSHKPIKLYSLEELQTIRDNFAKELRDAASGKKTSLAFIKNPLPKKSLVAGGETFQVMVIGGTNFISALVSRRGSQVKIIKSQTKYIPGFKSKKDLSELVTKNLEDNVKTLAINFAFELHPFIRDGKLDGVFPFTASKEHMLNDLDGKKVGLFIEQELSNQVNVSLANDTICLNLSGLSDHAPKELVGGVVGTGLNFSFFTDDQTAINLESAHFNQFSQTQTGKTIDQKSLQPEDALFEKEVSGAYLYQHYNLITGKKIDSTEELSQLAQKGDTTAQQLLQRSASLVTCQIAGIYDFKNLSRLTFIMEGSLFWKGYHYQQTIEKFLSDFGIKNKIEFVHIKNSSILGAAHLVI